MSKDKAIVDLEYYNRIRKRIDLYERDKTVITLGTGFYTTSTTILSNSEAVKQLSERVKLLEKELERTLYWWQKSKI